MNKKIAILICLGILFLFQIGIPAKMILHREDILSTGELFKFEMEPIDPSDPFRGRYITLNFKEDTFRVEGNRQWKRNEAIYVSLSRNDQGFAEVDSVSRAIPGDDEPYVKAKVRMGIPGKYPRDSVHRNTLTIEYPFERFYMDEFKAPEAERVHRDGIQDSSSSSYAIVRVKKGDAVIERVMVDGVPISEVGRQ